MTTKTPAKPATVLCWVLSAMFALGIVAALAFINRATPDSDPVQPGTRQAMNTWFTTTGSPEWYLIRNPLQDELNASNCG